MKSIITKIIAIALVSFAFAGSALSYFDVDAEEEVVSTRVVTIRPGYEFRAEVSQFKCDGVRVTTTGNRSNVIVVLDSAYQGSLGNGQAYVSVNREGLLYVVNRDRSPVKVKIEMVRDK
ncbi:MAG: hypothetical protein AAF585_26140 [Verrucomicrobiota bacterium]